MDVNAGSDAGLRYASRAGRWVLLATVLGSGIASLDGTVVNVALPSIGRDLGAGVDGLQWTLTGYLLTLASLILLGGSLGDRFGRRRVFLFGVVWFALASLVCGLAPTLPLLVAARALQGIGGALLLPGSLAIIQSSFDPNDRAAAIGAWSGLGGVTTAVGPFLGGWLIQAVSWRLIFLLNLPLAVAVVLIALRHVPESSDPDAVRSIDVLGAASAALGLGGVTFALVEAPALRASSPAILAAAVLGIAALGAFVVVEKRERSPMLPLDIFASRQFTGANLVTFAVYAALGGVLFLFTVQLQQVVGFTPLEAGAATFPLTLIMLLLSARAGGLAQRIGPRLPMTVGPLGVALGMLLMIRVDGTSNYLTGVLPAIIVFGLGLSLTVAPLTATVLAAAEARHAGIASGVNNAVARVAGLLAVSLLPLLAGITGDAYQEPAVFNVGFHTAMVLAAGLATTGSVLAWLTIRANAPLQPTPESHHHCALDGPPLRYLGAHPTLSAGSPSGTLDPQR